MTLIQSCTNYNNGFRSLSKKQYDSALKSFKKSATEDDSIHAALEIGDLYQNHYKNYSEAIYWYKKVGENYNKSSIFIRFFNEPYYLIALRQLGDIYYNGYTSESISNYSKAYECYNEISLKTNDPHLKRRLHDLIEECKREIQNEARKKKYLEEQDVQKIKLEPKKEEKSKTLKPYRIIETENASFKATNKPLSYYTIDELNSLPMNIRMIYRIEVSPNTSREKLKMILTNFLEKKTKANPDIDEVMIFAYKKNDFLVATMEWCPEGQWGEVTPYIALNNDRSYYKCIFNFIDETEHSNTSLTKDNQSLTANKNVITCDQFDIIYKITEEKLYFSIKTDLPDNINISVSVFRSFLQNNEEHSFDYYSKSDGTVSDYRKEHSIDINSKIWLERLKKNEEDLSRLGMSGEVTSISKNITISAIVPIMGQPKGIDKFQGKATTTNIFGTNIRTVEKEVSVLYPLNSDDKIGSNISLDPMNLDIGQKYILSDSASLMPHYEPVNDWFSKIINMPKGSIFKVLRKTKNGNKIWYKAEYLGNTESFSKIGWINSTALLGQQLKAIKNN